MLNEVYIYTFASVFFVSLLSFVGIVAISMGKRILEKSIFVFVGLAVGALLGDALVHLIPEALESIESGIVTGGRVVLGVLTFFLIERYLHWHHHGPEMHDAHIHPVGKMILFSDGLHNFLDGLIIATSYLVSVEIGIATTLAVMLHEIPQEIGDFGVLLHAGYTKMRALYLNFLSALLAVAGAWLGLLIGGGKEAFEMWLIPIAAGGFLYIAIVDLLPELHKTKGRFAGWVQVGAVILGFLFVAFL
jgi:zinc and cadmium transporter